MNKLCNATGHDVTSVTGVVRNVWSRRDCTCATKDMSNNSTEETSSAAMFTDDGPLSNAAHRVFSLSMYSFRGDSSQSRKAESEVMLYFYDEWADKCAFFSSGDVLTLSGPADMVRVSGSGSEVSPRFISSPPPPPRCSCS